MIKMMMRKKEKKETWLPEPDKYDTIIDNQQQWLNIDE